MYGQVRGLLWGIDSKLSMCPVCQWPPSGSSKGCLCLGSKNRVTTALSRVRCCCCWPLLLLPLLVPVLTGLGINIGSGSGGAAVFWGEERLLRVAQRECGEIHGEGQGDGDHLCR